MLTLNKRAKELVETIVRDRQYLQNNKRIWPLIESYSKMERRVTQFFNSAIIYLALVFLIIVPVLDSSGKQLPYNFDIFFLPVSPKTGFSVNWTINYAFQMIDIMTAAISLNANFDTMFLVLSHACFKADAAIAAVKMYGESIEDKSKDPRQWRILNSNVIQKRMRRVMKDTVDLIEYSGMVQRFISMPNCADTQSTCFIICTCAFVAKTNMMDSIVCAVYLAVSVFQLGAFNMAGQILLNKLDNLEFAMYDTPWYNLHHKQQKDIFFTIMCMQQLKGFKGIFSYLCNKTFYQVSF